MEQKLFSRLTAAILEMEQLPVTKILLRKRGRFDNAVQTIDTIQAIKNVLASMSGIRKLDTHLQPIERYGAALHHLQDDLLQYKIFVQLKEKNGIEIVLPLENQLLSVQNHYIEESDQRFQRMKLKMEMFKIRESMDQADHWFREIQNQHMFLPFMQKWVLNELFPIQMILAADALEFYPVKIRSLIKNIHSLLQAARWMKEISSSAWEPLIHRTAAIYEHLRIFIAIDGLYSLSRNEFKEFHNQNGQALTQSRRSNESSTRLWESVVEGFDAFHPEILSRLIQTLFEMRTEKNQELLDEWNLAQDEKIWIRYYNNLIE